MSDYFDKVLEAKLGRKLDKQNLSDAEASSRVNVKGLSLTATFQARSSDVFEEGAVVSAVEAAEQRVTELLGGVVLGQVFFDKETLSVSQMRKSKIKVPGRVYGLSDKRGKLMSGPQLVTILNLTLDSYIEKLMGTGNRLNWKTGRLSNSAQVSGIKFRERVGREQKNRVSVFFHYMIAPYSVFEEGGRQHKPGRDPSKLIQEALKLAMRAVLSDTSYKYNIFDRSYEGEPF